jgi:hypothetical protein
MRPGYFKIDEANHGASVIFPGAFMKATPAIELRRWLDTRGLTAPLVYRAGVVKVEISEGRS